MLVIYEQSLGSSGGDIEIILSQIKKELEPFHLQALIMTYDLLCFSDVQKSLETQVVEIEALRSQMLAEYEQMLSVRSEVMTSQSDEVEKLQREMEEIRQKYESEMGEFEEKVKQETGKSKIYLRLF